jgi:diaminopimelate decarboxylase
MTRARTVTPAPADLAGWRAADGSVADPVADRHAILRPGTPGGEDPEELAERHGTPYFAYDLAVVGRRVEALRAVLPPTFDLAYAVKANPSLAVLEHMAELGVGADVASAGELGLALRAGCAPGRIVITGPGKRDAELARAVEVGVRAVTVESPGELRRLARIAEGLGRSQPVLLRAAAAASGRAGSTQLLGDATGGKFGMDTTDLHQAAREAVESPWLEPRGIHAFAASNERDASVLADHVDATIAIGIELAAAAGFPLSVVDVGGGLGVAYRPEEVELDLAQLGSRLAAAAARLADAPATRAARVIVEPGRFLVAAAGAYVTRVVDRKSIGGRIVVIVDGGIHHLLRGVLVGQEHRVCRLGNAARDRTARDATGRDATGRDATARDATARDATARDAASGATAASTAVEVEIAGPLCTGLDVLARRTRMSPPEPGDLIAVLDVGAYGATESMPFFLSHPLPAELALLDGRVWVARPRIDPDVWLGWQQPRPASP